MKIIDNLPALYNRILPDFFEQTIQKEILATCHDCAMCPKPSEGTLEDVGYFSPSAKCCTYYPKLANYLVGAILSDLSDETKEGRDRIRQQIKLGIGVSPHSLFPPRKHSLLYTNTKNAFGRSDSLICPFFHREEGTCTIWKHRNAVCSTYFCKSVAGLDGKSFWQGITSFLNHVQDSLAWYVLKELNFNLNDVFMALEKYDNLTLEVNDLDERPPDKEAYRRLWQEWAGREEQLYQAAFSIVKRLTKSDLQRIIGAIGQAILEACKKRYEVMVNPVLPDALKRNPTLAIYCVNDGKSLISGPSGFFEIRNELAAVLPYFDGKKNNVEVNRLIKEEFGISLPSELLISLYQNRILIP